ncbi:hypothetical protein DUZ99_02720 [Xylanibacillus composti]|uniref:Carrier domain-containing protein n=1 Tax=Xylanibacillus composti TaxID=1572762 RepID=A0A8J4M0S5_9BACL|nr:phosphopantetheine-binding protein [Xylanibacillus composti]MDT9723910.1 hypothetical protein [Xylanibacillus composti]GIQ67789.1 hypothetical protein XYCOK13_06130 [Xylanibacillus composti]
MSEAFYEAVLDRVRMVVGRTDIELDQRMQEDLLVDSMTFIRLVVDLETTMNVVFRDEDLDIENFPTVRDLGIYLASTSDA